MLYPTPHIARLRGRVWRAWDATEIMLGEGDGQVFQIGVGEPEGCLIPPLCHLSAPFLDKVPLVPWAPALSCYFAVRQILSKT